MIERRAYARHKTFIKGRIYYNNRLASMDCIIRDATEHGARLECSENVTLPEAFELYVPNKDEYFHAQVKWRRGSNMGVAWRLENPDAPHGKTGRTDLALAERVAKLEDDVAALQQRLDACQDI